MVKEKVDKQMEIVNSNLNENDKMNAFDVVVPKFKVSVLHDLVSDDTFITTDVLSMVNKISESQVKTKPDELDDDIIRPSFDINLYKPYFDDDAWLLVVNLVSTKQRQSTCQNCDTFCIGTKSVCCTYCSKWYHAKCQKISSALLAYHDSKETSKWKCTFCKTKK
jgi:hypothetical protein